MIAISGVAQKISLKPGVSTLEFVLDQVGSASVPLNPGDTFTLIEPPPLPFSNPDGSISSWSSSSVALTLKVADASGRTGTLRGLTRTVRLEELSLTSGRFGWGHGPVVSVNTTAPLYLSYFSRGAFEDRPGNLRVRPGQRKSSA